MGCPPAHEPWIIDVSSSRNTPCPLHRAAKPEEENEADDEEEEEARENPMNPHACENSTRIHAELYRAIVHAIPAGATPRPGVHTSQRPSPTGSLVAPSSTNPDP